MGQDANSANINPNSAGECCNKRVVRENIIYLHPPIGNTQINEA
jgi:hypothetical protein